MGMANDEARMTNQIRIPNGEIQSRGSDFVIRISFDIRISSFVIPRFASERVRMIKEDPGSPCPDPSSQAVPEQVGVDPQPHGRSIVKKADSLERKQARNGSGGGFSLEWGASGG